MAGPIEVRPLRQEDDRSAFDSGNIDLDRFFRKYAGQNQFRHHIGVTYVACDNDGVVGFATVAATHIEIDDLPKTRKKNLPRYPLPVLRLARLAVDRSAQRQGVGKLLLRAVFRIAHQMAETVGCLGVVVDAKQEAIQFYKRYGFESFEALEGKLESRPEPLPMFLELRAIPDIGK